MRFVSWARYLAVAVTVGWLCVPAIATTRTYDNDANDADWFNPLNWDPDGGPIIIDELIVNDGVPTTTTHVNIANGGSVLLNGATAGADFNTFNVGDDGIGSLTIQGGADLTTSGLAFVGMSTDSTGDVLVTGDGSTWTATALVGVGRGYVSATGAVGTLDVMDMAVFDALGLELGGRPNITGNLNVDNASVTTSNQISIGQFGTSIATLTNGATLESTAASISVGNGTGSVGTLNVNNSQVTAANGFIVGNAGTGTLNLSNGGSVDATGTVFVGGNAAASDGEMYIDGEGTTFTNHNDLQIGSRRTGYMEVTGGADVDSSSAYLGVFGASADGSAWIDGDGSTWTITGQFAVGYENLGFLEITNDGLVSGNQTIMGDKSTGDGELYVYDGGRYEGSSILYMGNQGDGYLTIESGGLVTHDGRGAIGVTSTGYGEVDISGAGSTWTINDELLVGWSGEGYLTVTDGGKVVSETATLGQGYNSYGDVVIAGTDAHWDNSAGDITVGGLGEGILYIAESATVASVNGIIAQTADGDGGVYIGQVGEDGDAAWNLSGSLYVGSDNIAALGGGLVTVDTGGAINADVSVVVRNTGELELIGGTIRAMTLDHTHGGTFTFTGGTLAVDTFDGNLDQQGGTVAPGDSPGTTHITGDYTITAGTVAIEIEDTGTAGTDYDVITVDGTASLGGTLSVTLLPGYTMQLGDSFTILTADTILGTFDALALPTVGGLYFDVTYIGDVTDGVVLEVLQGLLTGDLNGDGFVGQDDLNIVLGAWGTNVTPGDPLAGDPSGDGFVGQDDLNDVLAGWGQGTPPSFTVVPEPGTLALCMLGGLAMWRRAARRSR